MADYSVNATQLSAPQGAGAVTVAPVATPSIVPTVLNALGNAANIFSKGLDLKAQDDAEKRKSDIVGQFIKERTTINDAVAQGMDAGAAASRYRASANKFYAAYPEYYKEFKAADESLKGTTELGIVEEKEKTARELRKTHIAAAQGAGVEIDTSMPEELIDKKLAAYDEGVRSEITLRRFSAQKEQERAEGRYNAELGKEQARVLAIGELNKIATLHMDSTVAVVNHITGLVNSGGLTAEQGQTKLTTEFNKIYLAIQKASFVNPELAGNYRNLFTDLQKVGMDMLDPTKKAENHKAKVDEIISKQQLVALTDPKLAAVAAVSKLMGDNPQMVMIGGNLLADTMANLIKTPAGTPGAAGFVPQVVGNPNVEQNFINLIKKDLAKLNEKSDPEHKAETANVLNHTLIQMGEQFSKQGVTPVQMKEWAALLASADYGRFATSGLISKQAAQQAEKVFKLHYETVIVRGINQKFENYLDSQFAGKPGVDPIKIYHAVNIDFSGSSVQFSPKNIPVLDPLEQKSQALAVKDLNSAQNAINQLIHMGAHLEGTTDYKKYWEQRKHEILPSIFPDPALLKVGQEVNGMIYTGGAYGDGNNWRPK